MTAGPSSAAAAQARWELENNVQRDVQADAYYKYDQAELQALQQQRPWSKDPAYFKKVRISALALLKMAMHAKSGGSIEVMGMLQDPALNTAGALQLTDMTAPAAAADPQQGKVEGDCFIVLDAFALPVEGTETRVNAQQEAYEYIIDFAETNKAAGRLEIMVGWYHSHPGYGCWLSGIDCSTQMMQQQYQDPFLAIVVDPHRTIASGKVEIGAFRTYPEGYTPPEAKESEYQTIPMSKIEDFGVHANQYYALEISYFKSSLDTQLLDMLWHKYWVNTLASSPLVTTRDLATGQITDISEKLEACEASLSHGGRMGRFSMPADKRSKDDQQLTKITRDSSNMAVEQIKGMTSQVMKDLLFNSGSLLAAHSRQMQAPAAAEIAPMQL